MSIYKTHANIKKITDGPTTVDPTTTEESGIDRLSLYR